MSSFASWSRSGGAWRAARIATLLLLAAACRVPTVEREGAVRVLTGLDRVAAGEELTALEGRRLGLVVHGASRTADGRHAVDILRQSGLDVVRLFSPEHGLRGVAGAGEAVTSGVDPESGLPVVSLYGERQQPAPEDLADLDALVFDLQGAGVRFYTYVSTLILCLEAAAESGIEMVVLDRPNPLGGERIEGPVSAPREVVAASFVNLAPGPLVHGLTPGEMARFVNAGLPSPARLTVVTMRGWRREMSWKDTGLPWVAPSPNLRSPAGALAYPGTALLEATNVSEGRGTSDPFLLIGAPWLEPAVLPGVLAGFALRPVEFVPEGSPAAPAPKYQGQTCRGWRVEAADTGRAEPYRLGVAMLVALRGEAELEWLDRGEALTRLVGTPGLLEALQRERTVDQIVAADEADHSRWRETRAAALLY